MPEGSTGNTESTQPPPPPGDQINQEINTGHVWEWLGGLFGGNETEWNAGGGGAGGKFMFASIEDLDAVIAHWKTELQAIRDDGERIRNSAQAVAEPAEDGMSRDQATATRQSLAALQKHNEAMRDYAMRYIQKLEDSRQSMVNNDQSGQARMNNLNRG